MSILIPGRQQPPSKRFDIYARSGWKIPQPEEQDVILKPDEMKGWDSFFRSRYPLTTRSLSLHPYNCVGMIFANRRAWIDIDIIEQLLDEDGYQTITRDQIVIGDLVLYKKSGNLWLVAVFHAIGNAYIVWSAQ